MKKCKCTACGHKIDLRKRSNLRVTEIERGYKYPFYEYYALCPKCNSCQKININELPFLSRIWLEFKSGKLKEVAN
ncbi:MAG: hypothetical protein IKT41_03410 [Clostridia bacterium]|nr:hypothetical protein [Clostridia bacterium]